MCVLVGEGRRSWMWMWGAMGVLAGWKSADGQLHDYWFTFVQGVAISAGLLDTKAANAVMDRLLAKFKEVGFTKFEHGSIRRDR